MTGSGTGMTLAEVAAACGARLEGDGEQVVRGVSSLADAGRDELGLLASRRYVDQVASSRAGALLVSEDLAASLEDARPRIVAGDAHAALVPLLTRLHPEPVLPAGVHPTAVLGRGVRLGEAVTVGPYAVLEDAVEVGDRTVIHAHVVVGAGTRVGADCTLHPHVTLYPLCELGDRVILHAGARVGSDGFGYAFVEGEHRKIPQVGRCVIEDDVELGANTCVDRGSIGATVVGKGTKVDNLVHLGHNVRVGPRCIFTALVGIAGSTRIGEGVMWGGQSGAAGHLDIGEGVRVAAQAGVLRDVPPGQTVAGFPARDRGTFMRSTALSLRLPELVQRLDELEREVDALRAGAPEDDA